VIHPDLHLFSVALALRIARFAGVPMDELLAGQWLSQRTCPHCGHPPDDFVDEQDRRVTGRSRAAAPLVGAAAPFFGFPDRMCG
jgi:hypothetical protein